jgi:hypothetical protein
MIQVKIYWDEGRHVEDNLFLGEFELTGIPSSPARKELRFIQWFAATYDAAGGTARIILKSCVVLLGLSSEATGNGSRAMRSDHYTEVE